MFLIYQLPQMRNTIALLLLLLAATALVCRSFEDEGDAEETPSWTEWAMGKLTGVFKYDQVKETGQDVANQAGDTAPGSSDNMSEEAAETEKEAAEAAKKLSDMESGH